MPARKITAGCNSARPGVAGGGGFCRALNLYPGGGDSNCFDVKADAKLGVLSIFASFAVTAARCAHSTACASVKNCCATG